MVDEAALAHGLKENWIAGAALDVYEKEPLSPDSPLRNPGLEDRCRLYPHFASAGRITRLSVDPNRGMAGRTVQALIDILEGNYGGDVQKMPWVVTKRFSDKVGLSERLEAQAMAWRATLTTKQMKKITAKDSNTKPRPDWSTGPGPRTRFRFLFGVYLSA